MRIALKIAAWMMLVLVAVQVVMGVASFRREARIVEMELRRDHRILGTALVAAIESSGPDTRELEAARSLLDAVEFAEREIALSLNVSGGPPQPELVQSIDQRTLITSLPIHLRDSDARLELREPMVELDRVAKEGLYRLILSSSLTLGLGLLAAAAGGQVVVGRRMMDLAQRAEAIGAGDLAPRPVSSGRDEVVDVASALERLAAQLSAARETAEVEQAARLEAVEQLRHADRMRLVGDLSAGVAHELGSPLHVVMANAEFLRTQADLDADQKEVLEDIQYEAGRMNGLVRRLLELAHPAPGGGVTSSLESLWQELRPVTEGLVRGTAVVLEIEDPPVGTIGFQPALFVQTIANLVRNAVQAQPDGGAVRVSAVVHDACVEVFVEDDGPGIPPELQERVFAPFFTTKAPGEGVGLGLPLVRGLLEEAGGSITVEVADSGGARFRIRVPPGTYTEII